MLEKTYSFRGKDYKIRYVPDPPGQVGHHPSWYTFEDETSVRDQLWKVGPGDLVIDVGAAYGSYALTALAVGASRVYCWSPQHRADGVYEEADCLRASAEANGWSGRLTVETNGIFNDSGWLDVSTQVLHKSDPGDSPSVFPVRTLDSWFAEVLARDGLPPHGRAWLKMDVEGAEVDVLRGATRVVQALRPYIMVENHLFVRNTIPEEIRTLLAKFGYQDPTTIPYHAVSHSLYVPS